MRTLAGAGVGAGAGALIGGATGGSVLGGAALGGAAGAGAGYIYDRDKKGKDLEAKMRVFNFADKEVKRISMTLDYLDGSGKKLKDFPWGMMGMPNVVGPKGTKVDEMGAFIPAETKKVEARVRSVEFGDGSKWEAKKE